MSNEVSMGEIIKTSIVAAFTIAAALIWKDVITDIINIIIPPSNRVFYKFIAAIIATLIIIIAIYLILRTESEAEKIVRIFEKKKRKK